MFLANSASLAKTELDCKITWRNDDDDDDDDDDDVNDIDFFQKMFVFFAIRPGFVACVVLKLASACLLYVLAVIAALYLGSSLTHSLTDWLTDSWEYHYGRAL